MKSEDRQSLITLVEFARRRLDRQWAGELILRNPDWLALFEMHFRLVVIERRLRRLGGSR